MKKRDMIVIAIGVVIVLFLWAAPEETTTRVPFDENHKRFYDIFQNEGKKAAEKFCEDCHNADGVPFPEGHPPKYRCLFCHKIVPGEKP